VKDGKQGVAFAIFRPWGQTFSIIDDIQVTGMEEQNERDTGNIFIMLHTI